MVKRSSKDVANASGNGRSTPQLCYKAERSSKRICLQMCESGPDFICAIDHRTI